MKTLYVVTAIVGGFLATGLLVKVPVAATSVPSVRPHHAGPSEAAHPPRPLRLLFIHHSVGSQLLAHPGADEAAGTHPNGGGLRRLLAGAGYTVGSLTYGSSLGERTDIFDWPEKFDKHLADVLRTEDQDKVLPEGRTNDVILFKSCYPNSKFTGTGVARGNPAGPELTVENAKAALRDLLPRFRAHPNTLFVYLTAPPMAATRPPERVVKWLTKKLLGRSTEKRMIQEAELARTFNQWVMDERHGWLAGYPLKNVAAVDYYDLLTGEGASNFLVYPSGDGTDSHPSGPGQQKVAPRVLAAINGIAARSGLFADGTHGESPQP